MRFFEEFTSNTCAGSGNQFFFSMEKNEVRCGRVFYKIRTAGKFRYSLLFSNILDSTYADGTVGNCNLICSSWELLRARIGRCSSLEKASFMPDSDGTYPVTGLEQVHGFVELTFDGHTGKSVAPGEFFASDPVELEFEAGEYLCLETTFRGSMIPYHEESIIPAFVQTAGGWQYCRQVPFAGMVGCDRPVKARIAYLGDSITQGIGTDIDSYAHWNAKLSEMAGPEYACWNLGIGFGRANDAASNGAWLYKAKQNDYVVVCFGVNDLSRKPEAQIKQDLGLIVDKLHEAGAKVLLQTLPPFDYEGERIGLWQRINAYILTQLAQKADAVFDVVPILGNGPEHPEKAVYGGHPNGEGCSRWAEALYPVLRALLKD